MCSPPSPQQASYLGRRGPWCRRSLSPSQELVRSGQHFEFRSLASLLLRPSSGYNEICVCGEGRGSRGGRLVGGGVGGKGGVRWGQGGAEEQEGERGVWHTGGETLGSGGQAQCDNSSVHSINATQPHTLIYTPPHYPSHTNTHTPLPYKKQRNQHMD